VHFTSGRWNVGSKAIDALRKGKVNSVLPSSWTASWPAPENDRPHAVLCYVLVVHDEIIEYHHDRPQRAAVDSSRSGHLADCRKWEILRSPAF